jgi:hypothetical protein
MKEVLFMGLLSSVLSILLMPQTAPVVEYDAGRNFSLSFNPNNAWQYGYSVGNSLSPDQFRLYSFSETTDGIGFWHPSKSEAYGAGYYPYVAFNLVSKTRPGSMNGWAIRAGQVAMEASNSGQYSVVRFVSPMKGTFEVTARFEGIHFRLSSTDVHVLRNGKSLFDSEIEGYGGDTMFHGIEGAMPVASYTATLQLAAGDTITFAVGYGKNKTHYNDTTGLNAVVRQVLPAGR